MLARIARLRQLPSWPSARLATGLLTVALMIALAIQAARLIWSMVTPIGPVGEWRPPSVSSGATMSAEAAAFDPFFRLTSAAPTTAVVTSLSLKLFGTRIDNAMGRGSAIIATPDGVQSSYGVGSEIVPGVTLKSVAFDSVTIDRGGTIEQLFLDQSVAAPVAQPGSVPGLPPTSGSVAAAASSLPSVVNATPRMSGDRVTGLVLSPKGDGALFAAAGLQAGDVVTAIDGRPVTSIAEIASAGASGAPVSLQIERGGRTITVSAKTGP